MAAPIRQLCFLKDSWEGIFWRRDRERQGVVAVSRKRDGHEAKKSLAPKMQLWKLWSIDKRFLCCNLFRGVKLHQQIKLSFYSTADTKLVFKFFQFWIKNSSSVRSIVLKNFVTLPVFYLGKNINRILGTFHSILWFVWLVDATCHLVALSAVQASKNGKKW